MAYLADPPDFVEPAVNQAVFATGVARAHVEEGNLHLVFYSRQYAPHGVEHVINLRLIMPQSAGAKLVNAIVSAIRGEAVVEDDGAVGARPN